MSQTQTVAHTLATGAPTPRSILDYLTTNTPLGLNGQVTIQGETVLAAGVDNGNDGVKVALFGPTGAVVHIRVPTAHRPAKTFQGGAGEVTYHLGSDQTGFWIGEVALRHEARALRIGSTAERLTDARHAEFLAACLVEALQTAGFAPGDYTLAVGFAIPNDEIVKESPDSDKLVVTPKTKAALRQLKDVTWAIRRADERGHSADWSITIRHLIPQAQSIGTFLCWSKSPTGTTVVDFDVVTILDLGGGDLQKTDISLKPYRMSSERRGNGAIDIARALKTLAPKASLNDVAAQAALISRQALISGKVQRIDKEVQTAINTYGSDLVGRLTEVVRETRRFLVLTGGGLILLWSGVNDLLRAAEKEAGQDYQLVPPAWASALNSIGALFAVMFASAKK